MCLKEARSQLLSVSKYQHHSTVGAANVCCCTLQHVVPEHPELVTALGHQHIGVFVLAHGESKSGEAGHTLYVWKLG